ncbi:SOS response-associated peptidase family protein [Pseudofulvimonas gallinarii]|uniref:Abasic site processing protein n=1 Tax=Pseudofulvimonas gallinarii TaxID=634155 RepID=A0A4R3LA45_9GAMM|nr:SOS response-associated peptidase family protein [Pseudofulvimonas gallinarii]TCS95995.1 putative SOS response-associated peptidase YedK [Pseudofulvimonas gallinarii]THD12602.1 hypothetical protein B1808_12205 [Pseudofulvimonas gallinarii]
MCYSAQVEQRFQAYVRRFGADIDIQEFVRRYGARAEGERFKTARGLDLAILADPDPAWAPARSLLVENDAAEAARLQQELFVQRRRVADAERRLLVRETKKALEDVRIGRDKVARGLARLEDLRRSEPLPRDARIFPGIWAPVLIHREGRPVVLPMRYQCRPAGKPAWYDTKYPGTYNARRDNLQGFWKHQFGHQHALVIAHRFYENVEGPDGRNRVLEFSPDDGEPMLVACLWSHWTDPAGKLPDLYSFAAITDEPPPEVAAAGHDRCIIPLREANVDAWLTPDAVDPARSLAILDDRHRPYYQHRIAA